MGKRKRLLAGSVLVLAASGLIAALWVHSPDASHPVAYDEHPVVNNGQAVLAIWVPVPEYGKVQPAPTAVEYVQPSGLWHADTITSLANVTYAG